MPKAIEAELKKKNANAAVIAPEQRKYSSWIGGSILASLGDFQSKWITQEMYNKKGIYIMHEKCNSQVQQVPQTTDVVFQFGPDTCMAGIAGESVPKTTFSRKVRISR